MLSRYNSPLYAIQCLLQGFKLLFDARLRHFLWVPLVINLLLFSVALAVGIHYYAIFIDYFVPQWLAFLVWLLWPLFGLSFMLMVYFSFTLIANVIVSPFYGVLAEHALIKIEGESARTEQTPPHIALFKGVGSSIGRLTYFMVRAIPLLILFIIPGINIIAPFLWLGFSAWVVAQEYIAYPLEAKGLDFAQQRELVKSMRLGLFVFGGFVLLGVAVPGLNILIPPAAVLGATLYQKGTVGPTARQD